MFVQFQTFPSSRNGFKVGMRLEGIDPLHPSMFCVLSVAEVRKTHFTLKNTSLLYIFIPECIAAKIAKETFYMRFVAVSEKSC